MCINPTSPHMNEQNASSKHSEYRFYWIDVGPGVGNNGEERLMLSHINTTIDALGWTQLNYNTPMRILCALDRNGNLVGWLVLQFFPHTEPLYVNADHRGTGLAAELADKMFNFLVATDTRGFMFVADSPAAEKLAQHYGLKRVDKPVYVL